MSDERYKLDFYNQYTGGPAAFRRDDTDGQHYTYESAYSNFDAKVTYNEKSAKYQIVSEPTRAIDLESQTGSVTSHKTLITASTGKFNAQTIVTSSHIK